MNARIENYLKVYNLTQFACWFFAIIILAYDFTYAFYIICFAQVFSVAEVFHAYNKWNSSSPFLAFVQIAARLFILFWTGSMLSASTIILLFYFNSIVNLMFIAWCIAEIIRYLYYTSQLFKIENKSITWLRYSAFILCYPVGLVCEFFVLYTVFWNYKITFVKIIVILAVIAYIFLFPKLYLHLLKQRKQKLSNS